MEDLDPNARIAQQRRKELLGILIAPHPAITIMTPPPAVSQLLTLPSILQQTPPPVNLLAAILGTTPAYFRSPTPEPTSEPLAPSVPTMLASLYSVAIPYMAPSSAPVYNPYSTLPPYPYPNKRLDTNKISQFTKTYDKENKYTGDPYDLINDKMGIFLNLCYYMDIQPGQFYALFSRIIIKRAETFYTHYVGT